MANLLPRGTAREDFAALDPGQLARFGSRLRSVVELVEHSDAARSFERTRPTFEVVLEELETEPSLAVACDLLDALERERQSWLREAGAQREPSRVGPSAEGPPIGGDLVFYWPGRSLSTGEANLASHAFFDLEDRPPMHLWIEAVARPAGSSPGEFELAILAWIPERDVDRARAGCGACTSGSLAELDEASEDLARQLRPLLLGRSVG